MGSSKKEEGKGFFAAMTSGLSMFGNAMHRSVNGFLGDEGVEVINPEGGKEDAEEEAQRGRWKPEERESYWKMMHRYIGSDVTSMVTLPVLIFEPMTMLQKMAELMEYSYLLDQADECEDPYLRLVYACEYGSPPTKNAVSISLFVGGNYTQIQFRLRPPTLLMHLWVCFQGKPALL